MTKRAIISEIMAMTPSDRMEILSLLQETVDDNGELTLSKQQIYELDRRIDDFERRGSRGEVVDVAFADLLAGLQHASHNHH